MSTNECKRVGSPDMTNPQSGITLVFFMFTSVVLMGAVVTSVASSNRSRTVVNSEMEQYQLKNVSDSLLSVSADHFWEDFILTQSGGPTNLDALKVYLDTRGVFSPVTETAVTTAALTDYHRGLANLATTNSGDSLLASGAVYEMGLPMNPTGGTSFGGAAVMDLNLSRKDIAGGMVLTFTTRVTTSGGADAERTKVATHTYTVAEEPWKGTGFGLLSKKANCISCHAKFDSSDRYYNTDPTKFGTFPGMKIGSLESFSYRFADADTTIAGTLYTRGKVLDGGTIITDFTGSGLTSYQTDAEGNLIQDPITGAMLPGELAIVDESGITDGSGEVPESFPSVIPDDNGNGVVDPAEFAAVESVANGTISGGMIRTENKAAKYAGMGMPATSNAAEISKSTDSNLILYGTAANPIIISGNIAVDGDVVLGGVVKGSGSIVASGNVYIAGSTTYADGTALNPLTGGYDRTYGVAQDGSRNKLAIGAGGNIMVGDFWSIKGASSETPSTDAGVTAANPIDLNFAMSETLIWNRDEWAKTQPTLPGVGGTTITNPMYDPSHTPRYYTMYSGDPAYIYLDPTDHYYDPVAGAWQGSDKTKAFEVGTYFSIEPGTPAYTSANISSLTPTNGWMDYANMKAIWNEMEAKDGGKPFDLDAMLYTNNSINIFSSSDSAYAGQMIVNGGIVASDVSVLVPGVENEVTEISTTGLRINYDSRQATSLNLRASGGNVMLQSTLRN